MIIPFDKLADLRKHRVRNQIIHCHGVFDILHAGHLAYFQSAKNINKNAALVVTITSDRYVNKGPGKPIFPAETRAKMLDALKVVNFVAISDQPTAVPAIDALKPNFYVKGPDYRDTTKDVTGEIHNEQLAVERNGGKIVFTEDDTFSSSSLANRVFVNWSDEQQKMIDQVKSLGGMNAIGKCLDKLLKIRVLVVGEPIVDTYRFCEPQNLSSKSPSISAKFMYEEKYPGGAAAIANHLHSFIEEGKFIQVKRNVPEKIRYISIDKSQRMFEVTHISDNYWENVNQEAFIERMVEVGNNFDMCIFADFGHGLFEKPILDAVKQIGRFIALNVQTNSSNLPFNPFTKHKVYDYLCIDTREARIAFHDKSASPLDLSYMLAAKRSGIAHSMTLGSNGAYYGADRHYYSPAFADNVVDATGAGDAYFALTSLLVKTEAPPALIPFLGNVFAGLKTKIIGNKSAVSKAQLLKACQGILK